MSSSPSRTCPPPRSSTCCRGARRSERSVSRGARPERWQTICREAAILAGRLRVPTVAGPSPLAAVLHDQPNPVMLVRGAPQELSALPRSGAITLLIGPEGGWTDEEL